MSRPVDEEKRMQNDFADQTFDVSTEAGPATQEPVFAEDADGNIITDISKAGQTGTIDASRLGDGMIDQ